MIIASQIILNEHIHMDALNDVKLLQKNQM